MSNWLAYLFLLALVGGAVVLPAWLGHIFRRRYHPRLSSDENPVGYRVLRGTQIAIAVVALVIAGYLASGGLAK